MSDAAIQILKNSAVVAGTPVFNSADERARYCVQFFEKGLAPALEHISPVLQQVFKDFSLLKQGGGETIMGCSSQEEWSQKYFKRTARVLRYMILPEEKKEELRQGDKDRRSRNLSERIDASKLQEEIVRVCVERDEAKSEREELKAQVQSMTSQLEEVKVQPDRFQKLQSDVSALKSWIRDLQELFNRAVPEDTRGFLSFEQRQAIETLVDRQP